MEFISARQGDVRLHFESENSNRRYDLLPAGNGYLRALRATVQTQ